MVTDRCPGWVGTCNLVTEFTITKFIEGSTCFERHTAHHQELQTVFVASDLYTHVVTGRSPGWVGTCNLVTEFTIPKFIEGSTCFERHTAHHQELQTVFAASGLYTHVVTDRCPGWVETCNLVTEFTITKFIEGSTCFERHTAHHQELQTVFVASDLYTHVVTGHCLGWVGTGFPPSLDNGRSPHAYIN